MRTSRVGNRGRLFFAAVLACHASAALAQTSTTSVVSGSNPSESGEYVTYTVTVSSSSGTPTGSVIVSGDNFTSPSLTLSASGTNQSSASYVATAAELPASTTVFALYVPGSHGNSSNSLFQNVQNTKTIPTSVTLDSSADIAPPGQSVTLSAWISSSYGTPVGTVRFFKESGGILTLLGTQSTSAETTNQSKASFVWSDANISLGTYTVHANFVTSNASTHQFGSATVDQTWAGVAATTTGLSSSPNPSAPGQQVSFTATVFSGSGAPTGSVSFYDYGSLLGSVAVSQISAFQSQGIYNTSVLTAGNHSITAEFAASNSSFGGSTSGTLTHSVSGTCPSIFLSTLPHGTVGVFYSSFATASGGTAPYSYAFSGSMPTGLSFDTGTGLLYGTPSAASTFNFNVTATDANSCQGSSGYSLNFTAPSTSTFVQSSVNPAELGQYVSYLAIVNSGAGVPTGTVQFSFPSGSSPAIALSPISGITSIATFVATNMSVGNFTVSAVYSPTSAHGASSGFVGQIVQDSNPDTTTTSLSASPSVAIVGSSVSYTAVIGSSFGLPSGTVGFYKNEGGLRTFIGSAPTSIIANVSTASFSTANLSIGSYTVEANFVGDYPFHASTGTTTHSVVGTLPTTTSLVSTPNPSQAGQSVLFTSDVSSSSGAPTGSVAFRDGLALLSSVGLVPFGPNTARATLNTSLLSAGNRSITAEFVPSGNGSFAASTSSVLSQVVVCPSITLASLPDGVVGLVYSQTAAASGGTAPYGYSSIGTLPTGLSLAASTGTLSGTPTTAGPFPFSIVATDAYGCQGSQGYNLNIGLPVTTTSLSSSAPVAELGRYVRYTTVVSASFGTPAGTIQLSLPSAPPPLTLFPFSPGASIANHVATNLTVGNFTANAFYTSTSGHEDSSGSVGQLVQNTHPIATLTSLATLSNVSGSFVQLSASVSASSGTPTGGVGFYRNVGGVRTFLGLSSLVGNFSSTVFTAANLSPGTHLFEANYEGSFPHRPSTGTLSVEVVSQQSTTTLLTSSSNPSSYGQSVTYMAKVSAGVGLPTGSVRFKDGVTILGTVPLVQTNFSSASFQTSTLAAGNHSILAEYLPTVSFLASSAPLTQLINKAATTTALSASPNPSLLGSQVILTASVLGGSSPTGLVFFFDGPAQSGGIFIGFASVTGGQASLVVSSLSAGSHSLMAAYLGDANHLASDSSLLSHAVNAPALSIADTSVLEGHSNTSFMHFTVALSQASSLATTVSYATADGTAKAGSDYVAASGQLTLPAGATQGSLDVGVIGDRKRERHETFTMTLSNPSNAALPATATATGTILNDDRRKRSDLNGDGKDDILWRKVGAGVDKGAMFLWLMDQLGLIGSRYLDPISEDWQVAFLGDLNGDGKTDVVWRNIGTGPDAGKLYVWMMDGPNVIGGTGYTAAQADLDWRVEAVGDLNGDGTDDILWRKIGPGVDKGAMFLWLMDGVNLVGARYLDPISEDWQVIFVGDLNGDGMTDIVWRNLGSGPDAGKLYIWMMDGPNLIGGTGYTAAQADLDWRVEAVGDLNGDGKDDILWRKIGPGVDKGAMFLWLMNDTGLIGARYLDPISEDWQVVFVGDLNGDGKTDVVWRNFGGGLDAGKLYVWIMDGPNVVGGTGYTAAQADLGWRVDVR